jgi:FAD/FMN-containing dehydrogenase
MSRDHSDQSVRHILTRRGFIGALGLFAMAGSAVPRAKSPDVPGLDRVTGRTVRRGEPDYESWRRGMPWQMWVADRYPDAIVRPDSSADVADIVRWAGGQRQTLAIKSGGHNVSEAFLRNGGILLDLGELQGIEVNTADSSAWVEPALWSHGLLGAVEPHGLAFPVAHCATVPMGGYLMGGGLGYNHDNWGTLACDSILAAEITLADGKTITASASEHPDLYWALRGAGTGFPGVVQRYRVRLYPAPDAVMESSYIYSLAELDTATALLQAWASSSPADTELMMLLAHNPMAASAAPPLEQKMCIVRAVTYGKLPGAAEATLGRLADHPLTGAAALKNEQVPTSLKRMQEESVNANRGLGFGRYAVDTVWTDRLAETMAAIRDHFASANSAKTHYVVSPKMNRSLHRNAAASVIGDAFVGAYTMWDEPEQDAASFKWLDGASQRLRPLAVGQYINEVDAFRDPTVLKRCFSTAAWERLSKLRRKYDPHGVFAGWPGTDHPAT